MSTMKLDIVYTIKDSYKGRYSQELKYSLRSLKGSNYNNIVIISNTLPDYIDPEKVIFIEKTDSGDKLSSIRNKLLAVNRKVSNNFVHFSDDYFIIQPIDFENWVNKCSKEVIDIERGYRNMKKATLEAYPDTPQFGLHYPFIYNKAKMKKLFKKKLPYAPRTWYANEFNKEAEPVEDCKIYKFVEFEKSMEVINNMPMFSTAVNYDNDPMLQKILNTLYPESSEYEIS